MVAFVDLLDEAAAEAARAGRTSPPESDLARRQAAEKIWGYVASELNRALRANGFPVEAGPEAHEVRKKWLRELDRALGGNFLARHDEYADLHGSCFYESRCPAPDLLQGMARDARTFVEQVKAAIREVKHRGVRAS